MKKGIDVRNVQPYRVFLKAYQRENNEDSRIDFNEAYFGEYVSHHDFMNRMEDEDWTEEEVDEHFDVFPALHDQNIVYAFEHSF